MTPRPEPYDALDWSPQAARELGAAAVEMWAELIESLPSLPIDRALSKKEVRDAVELQVPDEPMEVEKLLAHLRSVVFEASMYPGHPGFMAYISGSGTVPGAVSDLLAAGLNQNLGGWRMSPAATEIELQLMRWFAALFRLPETAGGMMTSGGAVASFVALKAARDNRGGLEIRQKGVADSPRLVLYASEEVHAVIDRAADMLGLGTDAVRKIPTDDDYRLRPELLVAAIERDLA
ncbi:MAG: pyridoxal phosphate-dependent decarboxylase family protein, partial [Actinomycetota bacterium]